MSRAQCLALRKQLVSCRSKRRYARRERANGEAERVGAIIGQRLFTYRCPICMGYHLTRSPQP